MNREDFPLLSKNIIYLDNGATTLKPKCVIDKMVDYYSNYSANAHRGDYDISLQVDNEYEGTRDKVKNFINAKSSKEIVFTSGTTDSLNIIANGFFKNYLSDNDEILISRAEHASNVLPWFRLANELNVKVNYIELNDNYELTLDSLKKSVSDKTKVIAIAGVTNVLGDHRPVKEIVEYAHGKNILVVIDGAQMVPHMKVDVRYLDIDFLAFSAHKMCGPTGVGVLYAKSEFLEKIEPINLGGGMNESFDDKDHVYYKGIPTRLEAGTPNIAGVIGLSKTIDYLNNIGMVNIKKYEVELGKYLYNRLSSIKHINIINKVPSSIISFNIKDIFAQDVAVYLNKYGICVRAGNHCAKILKDETKVKNTVRVSLYFYNTKEEIDKLVDLLKDKNKIINEML